MSGPKVKWLSPGKIATAIEKCSWQLRCSMDLKENGIPLAVNWPMLGGRALHKAVELALKKVQAGEALPPTDQMTDWVSAQWKKEIADCERKAEPIQGDESPKEVLAGMLALAPLVREQVLTKLNPNRVEESFKVPVVRDGESVLIWGQLDYEDKNGKILDWKTTKKVNPSANKKDIQMMSYGWWQHKTQKVEIPRIWKIFFVWAGEPHIEFSDKFEILPTDREYFEACAVKVWRMTQDDSYTKTTDWWGCKSRWCNFYAVCQGGE